MESNTFWNENKYVNGDADKSGGPDWLRAPASWIVHTFNVNQFLDDAEKVLGGRFRSRKVTRMFMNGGIWIAGDFQLEGHDDTWKLGAFWHPTKQHTAQFSEIGAAGGMAVYRSYPPLKHAPPGDWVVIFANVGRRYVQGGGWPWPLT